MYDFDKHLAALSEQTILCIGDLMLDEFVYGEVSRIRSPMHRIVCSESAANVPN